MTEAPDKPKVRFVTVDGESAGRRLDNFLQSELKGVPRNRIYRLIRKGEVRVNKGRSQASAKLAKGDVVRIPPVRLTPAGEKPEPGRNATRRILDCIVHEDDALLVLNKPSGLAVHGGSGVSLGAIELLRAAKADCHYLELVHRLDRDTSGLLLVAKKRSALRRLHEAFREGQTTKRYSVLVQNRWEGGERDVELPLAVEHRRNGERHVRTGDDGKPAHTRFTPEDYFADATLMTAELFTGRTHQIRVHAAAVGHPVAGDSRYGKPEADPQGLRRLFLHARELGFTHPATGEAVTFSAPLGRELEGVLSQLR